MDGLIYAYGQPRSNEQQRYIAQRIAEQRQHRRASGTDSHHTGSSFSSSERYHLDPERRSTISNFNNSSGTIHETFEDSDRPLSHNGDVDLAHRIHTSRSAMSSQSESFYQHLLSQPFELRHGRRYLRDVPYPLPCDLAEMQRQNLRTLLACRVLGRAVCAPRVSQDIPQRVLELGCGTGYWSTMCHEFFCSLGYDDVSFTGLDMAPLAPDLTQQGVNWTFVQHDLRRLPLPFDDGEFDLVMIKDLSLALPYETRASPSQRMIEESIRILSPGGTLEVWESDHCLRSLVSVPLPAHNKNAGEVESLARLGAFPVDLGTPFTQAQNRYLSQANDWIHEALSQRRLTSAPCARVAQLLLQEPEHLQDFGTRRIAIPLSLQKWGLDSSLEVNRADSPISKAKGKWSDTNLTSEQISLRKTALVTVLQLIENLEPILREVNGKSSDEWSHWWASMVADLSDPTRNALGGECLELGAWWAYKIDPT